MSLYIDTALPEESPRAFGLHPNAEIGYLTEGTQECFNTILNIRGGAGADGDAGASPVRAIMEDLTQRLPVNFVMVIIDQKAKPLLDQLDVGPFVVVALQECERMNVLLTEMRRSLLELDKGLKGQLNMSDTMEDLVTALSINQWPGRNPFSKCSWQKLAWPSMKNLVFMYADMLKRITQLDEWSETLERPLCLWLPGLFNPTAYLTAVSQVTGRQTKGALDKMTTETHVTLKRDPKEVAEQPQGGGVLVHGLYIEGARWPVGDEVEKDETYFVGNTPVGGSLVDGRLKELLPLMPIFYWYVFGVFISTVLCL
jgi:dynein heavy chain